MKTDKILVALAGQPNCGKSTVFNALTGARQHVANYPGVTVDKMIGWYKYNGHRVEVVDLPGTYSLTSYSPEERVSRDFIIHEKPSVTVNVMDATNLKRCLYLTFQCMEMETPVILNLNMMDVVHKRGMDIDVEKLSERLRIPVVPTAMNSGRGKKLLQDAVEAVASSEERFQAARIDYAEMEPTLREIEKRLSLDSDLAAAYPLRWMAIKLMEGDEEVRRAILAKHPEADEIIDFVEKKREAFEALYGELPERHIANRRYQTADDIARFCIKLPEVAKKPISNTIDALVCHRLLGPAIMVGVIWLLYYLSHCSGIQHNQLHLAAVGQTARFGRSDHPESGVYQYTRASRIRPLADGQHQRAFELHPPSFSYCSA